jgi:BolA protein
MTREAIIVDTLRTTFAPGHLEVINESHNHSVPKGSETHFKVVVVSSAFEGKSRVDRHRLVNGALADLLENGVHALTITSRTPAEWESATGSIVAESPPCLGGSKAG